MLTDDEKARIRSHHLADPVVRALLSGFLRSELRHRHQLEVPAINIDEWLERYVAGVDEMLELAVANWVASKRKKNQ